VYQRPDARRKLVRSRGSCSRCYQEPQSHERTLPRGRRWCGRWCRTVVTQSQCHE
jgi:hypothetical protein